MKSILFSICFLLSGHIFCQNISNTIFIDHGSGSDSLIYIREGNIVIKKLLNNDITTIFLDFGPYHITKPTILKTIKIIDKDYIVIVNREDKIDCLYIFQINSREIISRNRILVNEKIEELDITEINGIIFGHYKNGTNLEVFSYDPDINRLVNNKITSGIYGKADFIGQNKNLLYITQNSNSTFLNILSLNKNGYKILDSINFNSSEYINLTKVNCNIENIYLLEIGEKNYLLKLSDGKIRYINTNINLDSTFPRYYKDNDNLYYGFLYKDNFLDLKEFNEYKSENFVLTDYLLYTPNCSVSFINTNLKVIFQNYTYSQKFDDIEKIHLIGDMVLAISINNGLYNLKLYKVGYDKLEYYSEIKLKKKLDLYNLKIFDEGLILDNQLALFFDSYRLMKILDEYKTPWIASNYLFYTKGKDILIGGIDE